MAKPTGAYDLPRAEPQRVDWGTLSVTHFLVRGGGAGHDSVGATVWLALVLWLVMCVGELGVVSQSVLAMYAWIALFALPYFYRTCRHALDALVEETLLFVAEVVRGGGDRLLLTETAFWDPKKFWRGCPDLHSTRVQGSSSLVAPPGSYQTWGPHLRVGNRVM